MSVHAGKPQGSRFPIVYGDARGVTVLFYVDSYEAAVKEADRIRRLPTAEILEHVAGTQLPL
jgi:hypothetical protein